MEGRRQLDFAGGAGIRPYILLATVLFLFGGLLRQAAAEDVSPRDRSADIKEAFDQQRWQQVVEQAQALPGRDAGEEYYLGVALAQLGRWDDAESALVRGRRLQPEDARFPVELGGVAFKQKRYGEAAAWLRRALRLKPDDAYATDFLATIYFLQGNLDAALEYWNRIGKPQIAAVRTQSGLRVDPVLLDRAFAFAPGGTLLLSDLLTTRARVDGLGIFSSFNWRLNALQNGQFDAAFAARERDGWGPGKLLALLSTFRGVAYQTIYPEYFNAARSAINVTSLARWDAQKRRVEAGVSGPLGGDPKYRYRLALNARDEQWALQSSFTGPSTELGAFGLRRASIGGEIASFRSAVWNWSAGGEFSYRDFRNLSTGNGLPTQFLFDGYAVKQTARLNRELWRVPDRRFEGSAGISAETGRIWAAQAHSFEKLQGLFTARWLPRMSGDDYAVQQQIRGGKIIGTAPFDELYMLGLERDNDLMLRAHIGTRDGRKGSAPLGTNYFVSNSEIDKIVYSNGLLSLKLSPFLDTGKSTDSLTGPGSRKWLCDMGVQAKLRVLGVGLAVVYGKDLRSGNNAFYLMAVR